MSYYDEISEGYNELYGEEQLEKAKIIAKIINPKENQLLLDVGCGTGHYLHLLNCQVVGVDPSLELLKKAKHGFFMQGRAENLPFKDNYFDYVISLTAVQNFDDIEKGLKEINRVAKDKVVISILKRSSKFDLIDSIIKELFKVEKKINCDKDWIYQLYKLK